MANFSSLAICNLGWPPGGHLDAEAATYIAELCDIPPVEAAKNEPFWSQSAVKRRGAIWQFLITLLGRGQGRDDRVRSARARLLGDPILAQSQGPGAGEKFCERGGSRSAAAIE